MTFTTRTPPARLQILAIPPSEAARYRTARCDDFGNTLARRTFEADESAPCRVCLRIAGAGEDVLLLALRPFTTRGPYAEIGPVFIHADACGAPEPGFPAAFRTRRLVLRGYDFAGEIAWATLAEPGDAEAALAAALADPALAIVHVRSPAYGCYDFGVARAPA